MSSLIKDGRVWSDNRLQEMAVWIDNEGKIVGLLAPEAAANLTVDRVIDAAGQLVLPGGVDMHVHVQDGAENFADGTRAAAAGGITTVVDIAPFHTCASVAGFQARRRLGECECVTDFCLTGGIVVSHSDLDELAEIARAGAAYFKVFMPAEPPVDAALLWASVQAAAHTGLRMALHAEEVRCLLPRVDWSDPLGFPRSRPSVSETSAAAQALEMAHAAGAPLHICHVSAGRTAELVANYKARGDDVTAETTPHFLLLTEEEFARQGPRVKTTPPLRQHADTETLWQGLRDGVIDALACDHYLGELPPRGTPFPSVKEKEAGIAGLELSLPLIYDAGVNGGRLSLRRFVEVTSSAPAALLGLSSKGTICVGSDADIVLIRPDEKWTVADRGDSSRIYTTPYLGRSLQGKVRQTLVRGRNVWDGQKQTAEPGWGHYVSAEPHHRAATS